MFNIGEGKFLGTVFREISKSELSKKKVRSRHQKLRWGLVRNLSHFCLARSTFTDWL